MADLKNTSWASFAMTFCQNDFVMNMKWENCNNNNNSASKSSHVEIKLFFLVQEISRFYIALKDETPH